MNNKTRTHSLCEKMPYIAVILSMVIPMLVLGIGGSLCEKISGDAGNIGLCIIAVIVMLPIFAHGLHDYISFTTDPSLSADGIITQQYGTGQLVYELVLAVIIGIAALCLLCKNKPTNAAELWNEKWSNI